MEMGHSFVKKIAYINAMQSIIVMKGRGIYAMVLNLWVEVLNVVECCIHLVHGREEYTIM